MKQFVRVRTFRTHSQLRMLTSGHRQLTRKTRQNCAVGSLAGRTATCESIRRPAIKVELIDEKLATAARDGHKLAARTGRTAALMLDDEMQCGDAEVVRVRRRQA